MTLLGFYHTERQKTGTVMEEHVEMRDFEKTVLNTTNGYFRWMEMVR